MSKFVRNDRRALILGINGQDGSYLAEHLYTKGWDVIGIGRQAEPRSIFSDINVRYIPQDLTDTLSYERILEEIKPDVVFHTAAVHGPYGFPYESFWKEVHCINTVCAHGALEYIRTIKRDAQLIYFSSSKVFEPLKGKIIDENTERASNCIYTATKNCATELIHYYREKHDIPASVVWLFNHDSPRRPANYFIPTIVDILAKSLSDGTYKSSVTSLDFWSDWGDAEEYMRILATFVDQLRGQDLVMASGRTLWSRDFVAELFAKFGLDYREHILVSAPAEKNQNERWSADITKLKTLFSTTPSTTIIETCSNILRRNYQIEENLPKPI